MKKILLIITLISSFMLIGCSKLHEKSGQVFSMATTVEVKLYGENKDILNQAYEEVITIYNDINKLADAYLEYDGINNVYTINNSKKPVVIKNTLFELLFESNRLKIETKGHFNPFLGRLNLIYKTIINKGSEVTLDDIPDDKAIENELEIANNTYLIFDELNSTVTKIGDGLIDLGAIAKGYATRKAKEIIKKYDIQEYIVNAGQSSISLGRHPGKDYFTVGAYGVNDFKLEVVNSDIATSSVDMQKVTFNNTVYHHIIDPFTGSPTNLYDTILVIGDNSCILDCLSTAFMCMTYDDILKISKEFDVNAFVFKDNMLIYSTSEARTYE